MTINNIKEDLQVNNKLHDSLSDTKSGEKLNSREIKKRNYLDFLNYSIEK